MKDSHALPTGKLGIKSKLLIAKLKPYLVLALFVTLGSLARIHQLGFEVAGAAEFRETQTAFSVRGFLEGISNPLFSYLPVFGQATQVPFEFPIFQLTSAAIASLGFSEAFAGRFVSFFMFQASAMISWFLVRRLFGDSAANISLAIFQFSPFAMVWGSAYLIESTALAFTLASLVFLEQMRRKWNGFYFFMATIFAVGAFLVKITTPVGWFLGFFVFAAMHGRAGGQFRSLVNSVTPVTLVGSVGLVSALVWTEFANRVKEAHPITERLTSSALQGWNFGSFEQRTNLDFYFALGATPVYLIIGAAALIIPLAWLAVRTREERIAVISVSIVSATNIGLFVNLYYVHEYYFLAVFPSFTALVGWSIGKLAKSWKALQPLVVVALTSVVLFTTWFGPQGQKSQVTSSENPKPLQISEILSKKTSPTDRILVIGCDWNPALLYQSDRTGLMIPDWYIVDSELWQVEDLSTFDYVATCGDSRPTDIEAIGNLPLHEVVEGFLYSNQVDR